MARGIWRAAVPGVSRVRHDLAAQPPPLKINAVSHHSGLYRSVLSPYVEDVTSHLALLTDHYFGQFTGSSSFCGNDRVEQMTKDLF